MNDVLQCAAREIIGLLFPNRCHFCGAPLQEGVCICEECLGTVEIISGSACPRCGAPGGNGEDCCEQCRGFRWDFQKNVSLGPYEGATRVLVHKLKFEGRRGIASTFARLAVSCTGAYLRAHDLIVPVPLAPHRLLERGYNQSLLLARRMAREIFLPCAGNALRRTGSSPPQSSMESLNERERNMRDRIVVRKSARPRVKGLQVLLVDDVLTSGATASACAQALLGAGARKVDLFTVARALRHTERRGKSSSR